MEEWQSTQITKNLSKLSDMTVFNWKVKAELLAKKILSKADVEKLDADQNNNGNSQASYHCYLLLMGRTDDYKVLTKTLLETNQTGAARVLIRVPTEVFSKPLTYLDISATLDEFKDAELEVNGKIIKVKEFFAAANYEKLRQVFQQTVNELEIYDTIITKQRTFVLATNSIPSKPSYYISRFLSNRIELDEYIFKRDGPDVYVFNTTTPRYKLSQIAHPHLTDNSTSQLTKITSRFIYLDENEDWVELKKASKVPIHLINYEANGNIFLLEDTSTPSDSLREFGSKMEQIYLSEDEFVKQQLSMDSGTSCVCICDTPGMGKTLLLANIARLMTEKCTGKIIVFISLAKFATAGSRPLTTWNDDTAFLNVLKCISTSCENQNLLFNLIQAKLLQMEIFFDGFDEVSSDKLEFVKQVFLSIATGYPNVRMYITSRPHMREKLEASLGVVAYDILGFNRQNQVDFLVQFWSLNAPHIDQKILKNKAKSCLKAVNKSLTKTDKEFTGIPLLCQLIAEIYAEEKASHQFQRRELLNVPLKLSRLYQKFIDKKIKFVAKNKQEFNNIKLTHVEHALKLIFPDVYDGIQLETVNDLLNTSDILKVGILQKYSNAGLEFIHRTFAEYLVVDHFFAKFQDNDIKNAEDVNSGSISIIELFLKRYQRFVLLKEFQHPVVVYFFDSRLDGVTFSDKIRTEAAKMIASLSDVDFSDMLYDCIRQNLLNIFSLLREALAECKNSTIQKYFKIGRSFELLSACIRTSNSQMFRSCIQLVTEVLTQDISQVCTFHRRNTLLHNAAECANYEAAEYFVDKISLHGKRVLDKCVEYSYDNDDSTITRKENILQLLLTKDPTLYNETHDILICDRMHPRLIKTLVKLGANLFAGNFYGRNCAMIAARYMNPKDFYEFIQFLLIDCEAKCLFFNNEKWKDPLPYIIEWATLLPQTLELLLSISGIDMNMKNMDGENLLYSAVKRNRLNNLQQLVSRGIDYNARGEQNRSLLHAAASLGGLEMVKYLLALKLDPNACDEFGRTPIHDVVLSSSKLPVVRILVENGANVQAKDDKGQTPLFSCVHSSDQEVIKYLIEMGADVNERDNNGNTPLHLCRKKEISELLIEIGADIYTKNEMEKTPSQTNPDLRE